LSELFRKVLKMGKEEAKETVFRFDGFELRPDQRLLTRDGEIIHLTPRVFDFLSVRVEQSGNVVTKDELLEKVWGGKAVEEGNINRTVSTLRRQLGSQSRRQRRKKAYFSPTL
jgi:DNA-binding winged helix-turn-helix (wHTH) protein